MKSRLLGMALLCISLAGFIVVGRHVGAETPAEPRWWEMLLSLVCVPVAAVGLPMLILGPALFARKPGPRRSRSIAIDEP